MSVLRQSQNFATPLSDTLEPHVPVVDENALVPLDPNLTVGQLPNGLKYYLLNTSRSDKTNIHLVVKVGYCHESDEERGYAHLIQHAVFRRTANYTQAQLDNFKKSIFANSSADSNADTTYDSTSYNFAVPEEGGQANMVLVDRAISILSEFGLRAHFVASALDTEKKSIVEELRATASLQSDDMFRIRASLVGTCCENRTTLGNPKVVLATTVEKLQEFYERWYTLDRMAIVIVGQFPETLQIIKSIKKHFTADIRGRDVPHPAAFDPVRTLLPGPFVSIHESQDERCVVSMSLRIPYPPSLQQETYKTLMARRPSPNLRRRFLAFVFTQEGCVFGVAMVFYHILAVQMKQLVAAEAVAEDFQVAIGDGFHVLICTSVCQPPQVTTLIKTFLTRFNRLTRCEFDGKDMEKLKGIIAKCVDVSVFSDKDFVKNAIDSLKKLFLINAHHESEENVNQVSKWICEKITPDMLRVQTRRVYDINNLAVAIEAPKGGIPPITREYVLAAFKECEATYSPEEQLFPDLEFPGIDDLPPPTVLASIEEIENGAIFRFDNNLQFKTIKRASSTAAQKDTGVGVLLTIALPGGQAYAAFYYPDHVVDCIMATYFIGELSLGVSSGCNLYMGITGGCSMNKIELKPDSFTVVYTCFKNSTEVLFQWLHSTFLDPCRFWTDKAMANCVERAKTILAIQTSTIEIDLQRRLDDECFNHHPAITLLDKDVLATYKPDFEFIRHYVRTTFYNPHLFSYTFESAGRFQQAAELFGKYVGCFPTGDRLQLPASFPKSKFPGYITRHDHLYDDGPHNRRAMEASDWLAQTARFKKGVHLKYFNILSGETAGVSVAWPCAPGSSPEDFVALELVRLIMSERIYREFQHNMGVLGLSVDINAPFGVDFTRTFVVSFTGNTIDVRPLIDLVVGKVTKFGSKLPAVREVQGALFALNQYPLPQAHKDQIDKMTAAQVISIFKQFISVDDHTTVALLPETAKIPLNWEEDTVEDDTSETGESEDSDSDDETSQEEGLNTAKVAAVVGGVTAAIAAVGVAAVAVLKKYS